ncbi:hypothetical protein L208DRAFT_1357071 [Tricholoma matsutake]|nr:hypothetical protein L208DRAFT_1357071 [Tricholoma matsutake 945]
MSNPTSSVNPDEERAYQKLREKAVRFRILIIGRANSGKTTILQKICRTTDQPEIHDSKGNKVRCELSIPPFQRGLHNLENEMVFRSNPGFVFHDSRGFEAGSANELVDVKNFIKQQAKQRKLRDQIHAIWYCIPMDSSRPVTKAEEDFFSKVGTGKVPVIVIFTKFDAHDDDAYEALTNEGISPNEAVNQAQSRAMEDFQKTCMSLPIFTCRYPPKTYIILRDMNLPEGNCIELVEKTVAVLDKKALQALFVSTQRNQIELSFQYAVQYESRSSNCDTELNKNVELI